MQQQLLQVPAPNIWEPSAAVVIKDGEKLLELRGIKIINKIPIKSTVYYRLAEIETLLYNFLAKLESIEDAGRRVVSPPSDSLRKRKDAALKKKVQDVINFLKNKRSLYPIPHIKTAASFIISFAFDFNYGERVGDTIFVPSFHDEKRQSISSVGISLPEDIVNREIISHMNAHQSLAKMRLASKSASRRKYEYEHLINVVPKQAFVTLSKLYSEEKDLVYKQYLFSLIMRSYSLLGDVDRIFFSSLIDDTDVLVTLLCINLAALGFSSISNLLPHINVKNVDVLEVLFNAGLIGPEKVSLYTYSFSDSTSVSDKLIPFVEKIMKTESTEGLREMPILVLDLKNRKFSRFYDCRLMIDAVKKGYINEQSTITGGELLSFLELVDKCSPRDRELLRKYIHPNPVSDFFLAGIKPPVENLLHFLKGKDPISLDLCLKYGIRFSDKNVDYKQVISRYNEILSVDHQESEDMRIIPESDFVDVLKNLGDDKYLAVVETRNITTSVITIQKLGDVFYEYKPYLTNSLFVKYVADATDEQLLYLVKLFQEVDYLSEVMDSIVDANITDLEMYARYMRNIKSVVQRVN